ncbi:ORF47-like protein [Bufonid herpesvirus 1]|uniref:ORF47-like protein n=1 Tax=Bufonid herpesvirus 1 TaxID=2282206 RepID=UPI000EB77A62|nr:ORF47-like protein [Bufonid herpesvirus 1]AXF48600.1 ORF47-like protein [Bufonid herpesvirus 1]
MTKPQTLNCFSVFIFYLIAATLGQYLCVPKSKLDGPDASTEPFTSRLVQYGPFPLQTPFRDTEWLSYCLTRFYQPAELGMVSGTISDVGYGAFLTDIGGDPSGVYLDEIFKNIKGRFVLESSVPQCPSVTFISTNPIGVVLAAKTYTGMMGPVISPNVYVILNLNAFSCKEKSPDPFVLCRTSVDAVAHKDLPGLLFSVSKQCFSIDSENPNPDVPVPTTTQVSVLSSAGTTTVQMQTLYLQTLQQPKTTSLELEVTDSSTLAQDETTVPFLSSTPNVNITTSSVGRPLWGAYFLLSLALCQIAIVGYSLLFFSACNSSISPRQQQKQPL